MRYIDRFRRESLRPEFWLALGRQDDMKVCYYLPCAMCPHKDLRSAGDTYEQCSAGLCSDLVHEDEPQTCGKGSSCSFVSEDGKVEGRLRLIDSEAVLTALGRK